MVALSAPLALEGGQPPNRDAGSATVQLLAINDFHGNLEPPSGSNGRVNATPAGGAEYLATHLIDDVAQHPDSLVVAAGDLVGASPFVSAIFHDAPTVEALNAMHLSVSSVGNHEFDRGSQALLGLQRTATFKYLSANVVRTSTHAPLFPATAVRTVGGVKVGFIGETLRGTKEMVAAKSTRGLSFLDEATTANRYAASLKRQGVNAVVLLIHEGGQQHPAEGQADPNGCVNFDGAIAPILDKLTADIQVVISAHTHQFYNCRIGGRLVTSAGALGRMITRVTLDIDRSSDRITHASATNQVVTRDVAKDPAQTRIIAKYSALAEGSANAVVGSVAADLLADPDAADESPLGGVIADAQLLATRSAGAAVAFTNPGGIRADLLVHAQRGMARPGEVTYKDLYEVQPFGNVVTTITMTGATIKRLLEQQFDNPSPGARKILQVSNGFTYRYRLTAPRGQHVDADSLSIGGRRVGPTDRVRVTASDFLLGGGDGFSVFKEGTNRVAAMSDIDALIAYFKVHSPVAPSANRIVRID